MGCGHLCESPPQLAGFLVLSLEPAPPTVRGEQVHGVPDGTFEAFAETWTLSSLSIASPMWLAAASYRGSMKVRQPFRDCLTGIDHSSVWSALRSPQAKGH